MNTDNRRTVKRALLSVSDKAGITELARDLHQAGAEILSTGGTAKAIADAGIPVTAVDEVTGFPEILDGRVKTLHPAVHGGLLARRANPDHVSQLQEHQIAPIDLVCINLYPFEQTVAKPGVSRADAIENIDIGGPSMIRSAAKNHEDVVVLTDPADYPRVLDELASGGTTHKLRAELATKAFGRTAEYDHAINSYLSASENDAKSSADWPAKHTLQLTLASTLRYGENPHQTGAAYLTGEPGPARDILLAKQLHGKELSYNNINDAAAALDLAMSIATPKLAGAAIVKHANPCGAARAELPEHAIEAALDGDPIAAFGGIIALSQRINLASAKHLCREGAFLEVVIAPAFDDDALQLLRDRWKNVRLLAIGDTNRTPATANESTPIRWRTVPGAALAQSEDTLSDGPTAWLHAAGPEPTETQFALGEALEPIARALASNAVAIASKHANGALMLAGAGAGQMDRVAACRIAIEKAGDRATNAAAFSDAFFPFDDGPRLLTDAGITALFHPGGSKRDEDTFALCREKGVSCITTGVRHFRH